MASELKKFTRKEVEAGGKSSHRFIIGNYVYDVGAFLDEHPGGHEVLVNVAGADATEDFEDVGHSLDAKDLMKKFRVGELADGERRDEAARGRVSWQAAAAPTEQPDEPSFINSWKFPVLLGVLVTLLYTYLFG